MYTHPFFEATPPGAAPGPPVKNRVPVFATSGGVITSVSMANQAAVQAQFARLQGVTILWPVLDVLNAPGTELKQLKRAYIQLAQQIHPDRGGNFDTGSATDCMKICSRAYEQAGRLAGYAGWDGHSMDMPADPQFVIPDTLLYTEQPSTEEKQVLRHLDQRGEEEAQARQAEERKHRRGEEEAQDEEPIEISSDEFEEDGGGNHDDYFDDDFFNDDGEGGAGSDGDAEDVGGEGASTFQVGDEVTAVGLSAVAYNGRFGVVRSSLDNFRHAVELSACSLVASSETVRLKPVPGRG